MRATELMAGRRIVDDLAQAGLGEPHLQRIMTQVMNALSQRPDEPFPEAMGSNLDAFYELLEPEAFDFTMPLELQARATAQRIEQVDDDVVIIHDGSMVSYTLEGRKRRTHLGRISKREQGFRLMLSMAVTPKPCPCPLGVLALQPYVHDSELVGAGKLADEAARRYWRAFGGLMPNEQVRWNQGIEQSEAFLSPEARTRLIHVMDAEADAYELLVQQREARRRFVIAAGQLHRAALNAKGKRSSLAEVASKLPVMAYKDVTLHARHPSGVHQFERKHSNKVGIQKDRTARVCLRAGSILLLRPRNRPDLAALPESLDVNGVEIRELDPPEGQAPVHWLLLTSEAVDTAKAVLRVSALYEARWQIEELFQALKTGCALEKRQLRSAARLLMALTLSLPVAMDLLLLRFLSRAAPELPARMVLSRRRLAVLIAMTHGLEWSEVPTVAEACLAIAQLGGHLKRNGLPGWKVLGRGFRELLRYEAAWAAARRAEPGVADSEPYSVDTRVF